MTRKKNSKILNVIKEKTSVKPERKSVRLDERTVYAESGTVRVTPPRKRTGTKLRKANIFLRIYYLLIVGKTKQKYDDTTTSIVPPQLARYIIYLLIPRNNREAILGDLEEDFHEVRKEFGLSKAKFHYCFQVMRSILPIIGGWVNKLKSSIKLFIAAK